MPFADLGDVRLHYVEAGDGPLAYVFCHGLGGSGAGFEADDLDWYAERFRSVSWDQRGLGRSSGAQRYSLPLYARDLAGLLDHLGIGRAVVHGVSWGGVLAQRFALDFPERCAALVLDSTSSEVNVAASESWYLRGERARGIAAPQSAMAPAFAGHVPATAQPEAPAVAPEHVASYVAQARAIAALREHPLTPYLHAIACPALVIGGGRDSVAGAGGSVVIGRHVPGARVEIVQEAGHGVYRQASDRFRALLLNFLHDVSLFAGGID